MVGLDQRRREEELLARNATDWQGNHLQAPDSLQRAGTTQICELNLDLHHVEEEEESLRQNLINIPACGWTTWTLSLSRDSVCRQRESGCNSRRGVNS